MPVSVDWDVKWSQTLTFPHSLKYFVRGMLHLVELVTSSKQATGTVDLSLSMPALPRSASTALPKKASVPKKDLHSHHDAIVQELLKKQLLQRPPMAFPKASTAHQLAPLNYTNDLKALQYLLARGNPPALPLAPDPQPSVDSSALFLQNALTEILIQHETNKSASAMGNNSPLWPIMTQTMDNQGSQLQSWLQQASNTNIGTTSIWEQRHPQDPNYFATLLGRQSAAVAPAMFSAQQHDPALAALSLQLQALQKPLSEPKTPDLQAILLSILLQKQG